MKSRFIGAKYIDFTDNEGKPVQGLKVVLTCPDPDWCGSSITTPFIRKDSDLYHKISAHIEDYVNKNVDVEYMPSSGGKLKVIDITPQKVS